MGPVCICYKKSEFKIKLNEFCLWMSSVYGSESLTFFVFIVKENVLQYLIKGFWNIYILLLFLYLWALLGKLSPEGSALIWLMLLTAKKHTLQELGVDIMLLRKRHMLCDFTDCSIFFIWFESVFGLLVLFVMGVSLSIHCILSLFYHLPVMSQ